MPNTVDEDDDDTSTSSTHNGTTTSLATTNRKVCKSGAFKDDVSIGSFRGDSSKPSLKVNNNDDMVKARSQSMELESDT